MANGYCKDHMKFYMCLSATLHELEPLVSDADDTIKPIEKYAHYYEIIYRIHSKLEHLEHHILISFIYCR